MTTVEEMENFANADATQKPAPPDETANLPALYQFNGSVDIFDNPATFEHAQRVAKVFSVSDLVPPHMRGNVANCLLAYHMARRLGEEPLTIMRNIYFVHGQPGWKTEYMIARCNKAGVFKGRITWDSAGTGPDLQVTAKAVLADSGELVEVTTSMRMAEVDGWTKNPKYKSMPEHMLRWRSAAMLIRLYVPEVMLGIPTIEEVETIGNGGRFNRAVDAFVAESQKPNPMSTSDASPQSPSDQPSTESVSISQSSEQGDSHE